MFPTGWLCHLVSVSAKPNLPRVAIPFTDVKFTDRFWSPRLEANRTTTLPACFQQCEDTHRIANFEVASGQKEGKFEGIYFNDSDVYKVIEGAAYTLSIQADPKLDAYLDSLIEKIGAAQQEDGYLNTYYTLVEPDKRWTDLPVRHELYCAGHLFEAAAAHHRATGKTNLLDIATRFADHIDRTFGEDRLVGVPGHEETELALVKLYEVTGEERYLNLAKFFIDKRGDNDREYNQDHIPVRQQSEIVGHAVRAMYLYAGVADIAAYTSDPELIAAMDRIWQDVSLRKMYITGGIGPSAHNEGFTVPYDLPNDTAYAETCAAIGMALWSQRLFLMHGDSGYIDVLERVLYNGLISGVSLSGDGFFYVNPLASHGGHHRQPWYGCACCPTNVVRFIPQVNAYLYATSSASDTLWVNLYAESEARTHLAGQEVELVQETDYPWSGTARLTINPSSSVDFCVNLRIPGWCEGAALKLNGGALSAAPGENGYCSIQRTWDKGDVLELELPMPVQRIMAHPEVRENIGRVALQRGPIVYCLEAVDNDGAVRDIALPRTSKLEDAFEPDLLGGVVVLRGKALRRKAIEWDGKLYQKVPEDEEASVTAIPYYAWDHRDAGEMVVWLPETTALAEQRLHPTIAMEGKLAASYVHAQLSAVNDGVAPRNSNDRPNFDWWPHKNTEEWVSLSFESPQQIACCEVYWFDDTGRGGCRIPAGWRVEWLDDDEWRPVTGESGYGLEADAFNRVTFNPVETTSIRLVVQLPEEFSAGILEWRLPTGRGNSAHKR